MITWERTQRYRIKVLHIPGDGNCLFTAICHQLNGYTVPSDTISTAARRLRDIVVRSVWDNRQMTRIRNAILSRVSDEWPTQVNANYDQQVRTVLQNLQLDGFWGGEETITAVMEIFNVSIKIFYQNDMTQELSPISHTPTKQLRLFFRLRSGSRNVYNHYDSILSEVAIYTNNLAIPINGIEIDLTNEGNETASTTKKEKTLIQEKSQHQNQLSHETNKISSQQMAKSASIDLSITAHSPNWPNIKIGTWNVRGCNEEVKRRNMDEYISMRCFDLVAVQETKLATRTCDTNHYKWLLGPFCDSPRTARGLAFLIHINMVHLVTSIEAVSHNILACKISKEQMTLVFINVHMPQGSDGSMEFNSLKHYISKIKCNKTIILGDFNGHIGSHDLTVGDRNYIGPNLHHDICNDNGDELKHLLHYGEFSVKNTWGTSPSLTTTWSNSQYASQIDHMLCNTSTIQFREMNATWIHSVNTDHKLLAANLHVFEDTPSTRMRKRHSDTINPTPTKTNRIHNRTTRWDPSLLLSDTQRLNNYQKELTIGALAIASIEEGQYTHARSAPAMLWKRVEKLITQTASNTIPIVKPTLSPNRLAAHHNYTTERRKLASNPSNQAQQNKVHTAKRHIEELNQLHQDKQCLDFFNNVKHTHPQRRISMTYKFVRSFRKSTKKPQIPQIPISSWENELRQFCAGEFTRNIPENDHFPVEPPPTLEEIRRTINTMHNSTAPGKDRINIELIKYGPPELLALIHLIITKAWCSNKIPSDWLQTTQIPLPKTRKPKSVDEFRRIALSNSIYKIYATTLKQRLERCTNEIPLYQAGFLPNRSTDDHIFTLRRITEERWRHGRPTYIFSIDLKKAFDMVSINEIVNVLLSTGTPAYLINRIISAILHERTSIKWNGRRTKIFSKNQGVKQGCPISPYLFVIILNHAIQRACDRLGIDTDIKTFELPFLLAYADDIIILADSIRSIEHIVPILEQELKSIGLSINTKKCDILQRDPIGCDPPLDKNIRINGNDINVVSTMKYLGIYISNDLDRRSTVSHRIQVAYRTMHMLTPFFRNNRLSFDVIRQLYLTVILPAVTYGLKVSTLTKRNRQSLNRMEYYIVNQLRKLARDPPSNTDTLSLLDGRTIDRFCRSQRLKYWGHIRRRAATHILRRALNYRIPGKFKRGRPCFTWHNSLTRAIRRSRIQDWEKSIQDKDIHNKKCDSIYEEPDTDQSE